MKNREGALRLAIVFLVLLVSAPAMSTPRETLTIAAFATTDKSQALDKVTSAEKESTAELAANPRDHEASLQRAIAIGYRAKLKRSLADAKIARKMFDTIVQANPNNPEALVALAGWHLEAVADIGGMLAGTMLGARKGPGFQLLDRAVAAGRNREAFIPAYAALIRLRLSRDDPKVRPLLEAALAAPAVTPLDRIMQRNARALLDTIRANQMDVAEVLAAKLLPFGRLAK